MVNFKQISLDHNLIVRVGRLLDAIQFNNKQALMREVVGLHDLYLTRQLPDTPTAAFLTFICKFTMPVTHPVTVKGLVQYKERGGKQCRFELCLHNKLFLQRKLEIERVMTRIFKRKVLIFSLIGKQKDLPEFLKKKVNLYQFNTSITHQPSISRKAERCKSG